MYSDFMKRVNSRLIETKSGEIMILEDGRLYKILIEEEE